VFGPCPRHAQAAEGGTNCFVADKPRGEALGETDFGRQGESPSAGGLAIRPRAVVQQRPESLAGASVEDHSDRMRPRRLRPQRRKTALMERMNGVAHALVGAAEGTRNGGGRLPFGTGEEHLAAAYRKGGRGPETGLQSCPLVRHEQAYK
jgi:hypothetical protein